MTELPHKENSSLSAQLLVLEIGTEEIPARFLPDTITSLGEQAAALFLAQRLPSPSVKTYATPRRLSLLAEIEPWQRETEKEVWGPPVTAAYDGEGRPTKAAEAFAKSCGVPVETLSKKEKGKGVYVIATVRAEAQQTIDLLPEILPKLILSLSFPKSMRWGDGILRFVRPIQWIYALYNNEKVRFEIDGLKSGTITRGHRFLSPAAFEVRDGRTYVNLLRNNFVILDPEERRKMILDGSQKLASSAGAALVEDADLLQHVMFLIEYPVPVLGTFPAEYLSLPKELLITVMKDHQKYFALQDSAGKLTNCFIVVSNTKQDNAETIRKGAEKVIKARFEDARFYYEEDRKTPLERRIEGLKKVIYHDRLGSLYDKSLRISSIADFIARRCCPDKKDEVRTAAILAKADLISGVVREFPELQGIMGSYYALHDGHSAAVAKAIAEHYLPTHSGGKLPESDTGAVVSLSDKLDNIASFFMLGQPPTGTEDPFALRRQALGITAILIDKAYALNLTEILEKALEPFTVQNKQALVNDMVKFFEQRMEPLFTSAGYPQDSIWSVLHLVSDSPLSSIKDRLDALKKIREEREYDSFLLVLKRVNNISPKVDMPPVREDLFQEEEESMLHREVEAISLQLQAVLKEHHYYSAIKLLQQLTQPINTFFEKVLVMDKRDEIKGNRLSLLRTINQLTERIADFSKLS